MVGTTLMRLRKINNLSSTEMAKKLNMSASYLSEIENGKKSPSLLIVEQCSIVLGINMADIICLHEYITQDPNITKELAHYVRAGY